MSRRESHLHGLLIVDKPGLQQLIAQQPPPEPSPEPPVSSVDPSNGGQNKTTRDLSTNAIHEDPPRLYTSHDIVQIVRRLGGQRRIGHTGTLDPMASGILVLCLGQATRLVEYYQGHDKTYYAEVTLGQATDTYDAMGQVVETAIVPPLSVAQIEDALAQFRGDILQVPPIYSALKQGGESLHRKARRGEAVTVQPRAVTMHTIELVNFHEPDRLCLRVTSSAGTYIRSLAYDLGRALGCCAHLSLLRREAAGHFTLPQSVTLPEIEAAAQAQSVEQLLLPMGTNLQMPEMIVSIEAAKRLGQGQKVYLPINTGAVTCFHNEEGASLLAKLVDENARFLGIGRCLKQNRVSADDPAGEMLWKAEKWLAIADESN